MSMGMPGCHVLSQPRTRGGVAGVHGMTRPMQWPAGKAFEFTVFDDPDHQAAGSVEPVYSLEAALMCCFGIGLLWLPHLALSIVPASVRFLAAESLLFPASASVPFICPT